MYYISTRNAQNRVTAAQAILSGLAEDGGLYVPERIPKLSKEKLQSFVGLSYQDCALAVLGEYLDDFSPDDLRDCVKGAYTIEKFGSDKIAPLHHLDDTISFLELWHGPTCAFKDMALQILPHFLTKAIKMQKTDKTIVILVATSGDTGKAALEGFANVAGTKIIVFYPAGGVSQIQKLQMVTQEGNNVCTAAVKGNFDDVQSFVKQIFTDEDYRQQLNQNGYDFSSANSINWGRLVPQIVYYVYSYCQLVKQGRLKMGEPMNVVVPTGNFGNILAAYYAKKAGVPIQKLICASNRNNILTDFIRTGIYDKNREFSLTISPSMDILISSNLERLLYDLSDTETVIGLIENLQKCGRYEVPTSIKETLDSLFWAGYCGDDETRCTIRETFEKHSYLIDTHTAVGYHVYRQYVAETGDQTKTVLASTASPFKFNQSVYQALRGAVPENTSEFELLSVLSEQTGAPVPVSLKELADKKVRFDQTVSRDEMYNVVSGFLGL